MTVARPIDQLGMSGNVYEEETERDRCGRPKSPEVHATLMETVSRRTKQKRNQGGSPKSMEWYRPMRAELNAKPFDPIATDQGDVENELQSGLSILVLESTPNRRSHCRTLFCLRYKLTSGQILSPHIIST